MPEFQTSPGMRDILAPESDRWRRFVEVFADVVDGAGYEQIIPPLLEDIEVFKRVGEATDVVSKEMYEFTDLGGRHVALRPEQTASVCRAFVQHRPTTPWKTWYAGPNFRYEKPQRGRYRQFDQVGIEVLGADDPYLDAEVIALGWRFFAALGLRQVTLLLNSLGEPADRQRYVDALRAHFTASADELSAESRATLDRNALPRPRFEAPAGRRADRRRTADRRVLEQGGGRALRRRARWARCPRRCPTSSSLGSCVASTTTSAPRSSSPAARSARRRTRSVAAGATTASSRPWVARRRRVSGSPSASIARCWRVMTRACSRPSPSPSRCSSSTPPVDARHCVITEQLRQAGISADRAYDGRSMKAQMKAANRSGAAVAVIVGDDERASGTAVVRPLRDHEGGGQAAVARTDLLTHLEALLR